MFNRIGSILERICALISALIFAQAPLFMQHYTQQLAGREAELHIQVDAMRSIAKQSGKTLDQLIQKFIQHSDLDIMHQGELMQGIVDRWQQFSHALLALQESSFWSRPFLFVAHLNIDTFKSTLHQYHFGLPLTMDGAFYAGIGAILGYFALRFLRGLCSRVISPQRAQRKQRAQRGGL